MGSVQCEYLTISPVVKVRSLSDLTCQYLHLGHGMKQSLMYMW